MRTINVKNSNALAAAPFGSSFDLRILLLLLLLLRTKKKKIMTIRIISIIRLITN